MDKFWSDLWLCFVPLFVAVDMIGILPMFIHMTGGVEEGKKKKIIIQSMITALIVSILFLFVGIAILSMLSIEDYDFMIAGGILLFLLSISDLLSSEKKQRHVDEESIGAVPLGVPLIAGPAVLATIILLVDKHGYAPTLAALIITILMTGTTLWFSRWLMKILGSTGATVLSKLASLLLAAIGVMIVRSGIMKLVEAIAEKTL